MCSGFRERTDVDDTSNKVRAEKMVDLGKTQNSAPRRTFAIAVISMAMLVIVFFVSLCWPQRDSESWKLINPGMSKQQVLGILGEPEIRDDQRYEWRYDFGGVDYFIVKFYENDHVKWTSF